MGWTVWTTREGRTSLSSPTLPVGGNELSFKLTSSHLVSEVISVGEKEPQLWTDSKWPWLEGFCPFLLSFSPLQFAPLPFCDSPLREIFLTKFLSCPALQSLMWSGLWCDQLLCNVLLKTGALPVACCALTCQSHKNLGRTNISDEVRMHWADALKETLWWLTADTASHSNPNCHYWLYLRLLQTDRYSHKNFWDWLRLPGIEEAVVISEQNLTHLMSSSRIWLRFCSVQIIIVVAAISTTTTTTGTTTATPILLLLLQPGATLA